MIELDSKQMQAGVMEAVLQGDLNARGADQLLKFIDDMLVQGRNRVILDCGGLGYVSSAGMATLITLHRKLQDTGGRLLIAGATGPVFELLDLMNLGSILELYPDMDGARQAFNPT